MTVDEALAILDRVLDEGLNDVQGLVFRHSWEGQTYQEIAYTAGYDPDYIKDVGSKLWQLLGRKLGKEVTKKNVKSVLEQYSRQSQGGAPAPQTHETRTAKELDAPGRQDWGEAPDISTFLGRSTELDTLKQWILQDRCRLVTLLGMGGMGKTALAAKLAEQVQNGFEYLIWRSLRHVPPLWETLADLNAFLSNEPATATTLDAQISQLLKNLRTHRYLIVLDDWEMVLRDGDIAGYYREGYEGYGQLLKRIGEERHQSCVLLVTREKPVEVASLAGDNLPVRALQLKGLKAADAKKLLATKGFTGAENGLEELIQLYRGHPAALKMVATTIQELFDGDITQFVGQSSLVIGDIFAQLLQQHFGRLSDLGKAILYWLAIEGQPISLAQLKIDLWLSVSGSELLAALESLLRRSLIEKELSPTGQGALFTLQPVVMKYITNQFIDQICRDILAGIQTQRIEKLGLLRSHAIAQEEASQENLIVKRIQERLRLKLGNENDLKKQLLNLLSILSEFPPEVVGYAKKNLVKLLGETEA